MKLNVPLVKKLKKKRGLTYDEIAKLTGLNSRQHVFDYIRHERISGAEVFAKAFKCKPIDLII